MLTQVCGCTQIERRAELMLAIEVSQVLRVPRLVASDAIRERSHSLPVAICALKGKLLCRCSTRFGGLQMLARLARFVRLHLTGQLALALQPRTRLVRAFLRRPRRRRLRSAARLAPRLGSSRGGLRRLRCPCCLRGLAGSRSTWRLRSARALGLQVRRLRACTRRHAPIARPARSTATTA